MEPESEVLDEVPAEEPTPSAKAGSDGEAVKVPERSQIKFAYSDIDDAVAVARKIKEVHGGRPIALDQLAAALGGTSVKSGAFRTKVATAATFGAVKTGKGHVELTDLGHRLADEDTRSAALAEAFLNVPLYRAIYERYRDVNLPGDIGLENDVRSLGVVANQADRARQVLQRSADKAGFFWGGRNRLVMPPAGSVPRGQGGTAREDDPTPLRNPGGGGDVMSNALLQALFKKMLPAEAEPFSAKDRRRFFRALAVNLDVIYGEPEDGEIDADVLATLYKAKAPAGG